MVASEAGRRPAASDRAGAERLVADLVGIMGELEAALQVETEHLAAGRIRAGLAGSARKSELAAAYLQGQQAVKANAVALARHAPHGLASLQVAQMRLQAAVARNQVVVETARSVSEGLVRSLAGDVAARSRPAGYGPARPAPRAATPLVYSART